MGKELAYFGSSPAFKSAPSDPFEVISPYVFEHVSRRLAEGRISTIDGDELDLFERRGAEFFGAKYGAAMCTGTAAIHAVLVALGIGPGDEVIVATYAYHATVLTICVVGAKPVFADIKRTTLTIDPADVVNRITARTKAIMVLHPWGNLADVDAFVKIREHYGVPIIADASHAHGATWDGKPLGAFFDVVVASFGKGKLISGGELGLLACNDRHIQQAAIAYFHPNRVPKALVDPELKHFSNAFSIKYRPHALATSIALRRLDEYPILFSRLVQQGDLFSKQVAELPGFRAVGSYEKARRAYWKMCVCIDTDYFRGIPIQMIVDLLCAEGIPARLSYYFPLMHEMNVVTEHYGVVCEASFPASNMVRQEMVQFYHHFLLEEDSCSKVLNVFAAISNSRDIIRNACETKRL
jgi:perosamine synthetase